MSIITAGFEHGMRNAVERRAKKRAAEMAQAAIEKAGEKAAKDKALTREAIIEFMRSQGIPDEEINAFIRQLP